MSKNYRLKSGVELESDIEDKIEKIADAYHKETGKTITITSGTRSPEEQAAAMYDKLDAGDDLSIYKDQESALEIKKVYDAGKALNKDKEEIIQDMTDVIEKQIADGKYISKHLKAGAVDVRSRDMSDDEKEVFKRVAEAEADSVILETTPPHWHLQFD